MYYIFLILASLLGEFAAKDYTGYKVLRVTPPDESSFNYLHVLESQYDFWSESRGVGYSADIMVSEDYRGILVSKLEERGFNIETMIDDIQPLIDGQMNTRAQSGFSYDDYHTLDEIRQWMLDFTAENSDLVQMEQVGTTYEGRDIQKIKISSDFSDTTRPIFFMIGGTHSREWVTPATMMAVAKRLVDESGTEGNLLELMDFHIVPVFNQDGYHFTWTDDRMWRKTRSPNDASPCVGTDPNRNWDCQWGTGGSSNFECSATYMGSKPASEIEIKNMQDHVSAIRDRVKVFMDVHAYSQYWMYPYGHSDVLLPADDDELREASKAAVDAVFSVHGKVYENGPIATVIYVASGSSADWGYDVAGIKHSYALELRDTGEWGFLLPPSQISDTAEEFFAGCAALTHYLRDHSGL